MQKISDFLRRPWAATLLALLLGFLMAALVLLFSGCNPFSCFGIMCEMIFTRPKNIVNVIVMATPLILTGVGISFAYQAGLFNIGAEGQYIMGAVAAAMAGSVITPAYPAILAYPLVVLSGVMAGMIYAAVIGYLKAKAGVHEVITGIMLNWIAFYFSNFIAGASWFHEDSSVHTREISETAMDWIYRWKMSEEGFEQVIRTPILRDVFGKTNANFGIIYAVMAALLFAFLLRQTKWGYELRAAGKNASAATFAGIHVHKSMILSMTVSGAVAGLAGALQVVGVSHYVSVLATFENYGFNGLSVALIAGASPGGCIWAGLLFAALQFGGAEIQTFVGAPSEVIQIMIGTIVFFVALSRMIPVLADRLAVKAALERGRNP